MPPHCNECGRDHWYQGPWCEDCHSHHYGLAPWCDHCHAHHYGLAPWCDDCRTHHYGDCPLASSPLEKMIVYELKSGPKKDGTQDFLNEYFAKQKKAEQDVQNFLDDYFRKQQEIKTKFCDCPANSPVRGSHHWRSCRMYQRAVEPLPRSRMIDDPVRDFNDPVGQFNRPLNW